jgi:hypothetical protein
MVYMGMAILGSFVFRSRIAAFLGTEKRVSFDRVGRTTSVEAGRDVSVPTQDSGPFEIEAHPARRGGGEAAGRGEGGLKK